MGPDHASIDAAVRDWGAQQALRVALRAVPRDDSDTLASLLDPLAEAAAAGSAAAVDQLVWAVDELGLARPAIRRLLVDDGDVDEAAQDVLVAVAEKVRGFRGDARFTTWLHRVARFKAIAYLRRKRPTEPLPDDGGAAGAFGAVGDAQRISSLIATRTSIDEILDALPPEYREPVVLRDIEQLPYDEVAARLQLKVNTAKTRMARGRALVAARLAVG